MVLSDDEIDHLIKLEKQVTNPKARRLSKRGSEQVNYEAAAPSGERFRVYIRQNLRLTENFSCGLLWVLPSGDTITLARYNGCDHAHVNPIEGTPPLSMVCHIHRATEKYMRAGRKAEHYAEATLRYKDCAGALQALVADCNIRGLGDNPEDDSQGSLL